jgi:hypothetical protein
MGLCLLLFYISANTCSGAYTDTVMNPGFIPIPQLQRPNTDLTLFFLSSNNIVYPLPVDDPWFSAHREARTTGVYQQDEPVRVLGCLSQMQYCDADTNCEPLRPLTFRGAPNTEGISKVWTSQRLRDIVAAYDRVLAANRMHLLTFVGNIGAAALSSYIGQRVR